MDSVPHGESGRHFPGPQRSLGWLSAIVLMCSGALFWCKGASAAEPGAELTIALLTMGPGQHPFTKFGHSAIWVHDASRDRDEVYNYGTFAFDSPSLLLDSVAGKLPYWLSVQSLAGTLRTYDEQGRSLLASELQLLPTERAALLLALRENARPEHRYYRYDYYRDNCATRVRDVIDRVIGGRIQEQTGQAASMSYRAHTQRLVADDPVLYVGLDLAIGRQTDAPITFWDEGFLPERLHDLLARTHITRDGRELGLIRAERTLLSGRIPAPRPNPPQWSARFAWFGVALGAAFAALGVASRTRSAARVALGLGYLIVGSTLGLLGCALGFLTFFSGHTAAASNYNVLLAPPWALALAASSLGVMRGNRRSLRVARWTTSAALAESALGLALHALTHNPQSNAQELWVALPLWLGATVAAFLASRAETETAPAARASLSRPPAVVR